MKSSAEGLQRSPPAAGAAAHEAAQDGGQHDLQAALAWYDEDYLHFSAATTDLDRTENEVEFIWRVLGLRSGERVLDLGCGHGRIANGLAGRGAVVTGIDAVPLFLERARADAAKAGVSVHYREGDMRDLAGSGPYDAVILWFFSFGYHSDEDNLKVLDSAARVLRPGGRLLIDQYNTASLARAGDAYRVLDLGESLLLQRPVCDLENGRWGAERIAVRDGAIRRSRFMCRCYSPSEMKVMLAVAGFESPSFWGDGFQPLGVDSTKQIVLAAKRTD